MIYPGFGTTYVVDYEVEKNRNWKVTSTVYVLESGLYYILPPSRIFTLLTALPGVGEANLGANVGGGAGLVFKNKTSVTLNFKSILAGSGISVTNNADDILIANTLPHITNYRNYLQLPNSVDAPASTAFVDLTGLAFNVVTGTTYRVRATLLYSVLLATTGIKVSYTGPAMARMAKMVQAPLAKTGTATNVWTDSSDTADDGTSSNSSMSTGGNICVADFIFQPSGNGVFQLRFGSEVITAASVTVEEGSTLEWW